MFRYPVRGRISSSPALYDIDGDGRLEVIIGGPRLFVLTPEGRSLRGWPRKGRKPFASSPAVGDIDGDGNPEVVVGCDDGKVYAWDARGDILKGWPVTTGRDVFSTPALADIDGDGHPEVIVGSDDGRLYVLDGEGAAVAGFPVATGGFISSSPAVGDIDKDGRPEILVGSWDKKIHGWRSDGSRLPGWPFQTGHFVWSSPILADIDGDGKLEIIVASDLLYVLSSSGQTISMGSTGGGYCVASPAMAGGGGNPLILSAAASVVASRLEGGWTKTLEEPATVLRCSAPSNMGGYVWSSPVQADVDGDGENEILVASWDGSIHVLRETGKEMPEMVLVTSRQLFSTPAIGDIDKDGHLEVAVGSWDGHVYVWKARAEDSEADWPMFKGGPTRTSVVKRVYQYGRSIALIQDQMARGMPEFDEARLNPPVPVHRVPTFLAVGGKNLGSARGATMWYRVMGESGDHPVPMLRSGDNLIGIVQPLGALRKVSLHVECTRPDGGQVRAPPAGEWTFTVAPPVLANLRRAIRLENPINDIAPAAHGSLP